MNAIIITIGNEILIGQTVDTNSAWIAQELNLIGIEVSKIISILDEKEEISRALDEAISSVDFVIITGGLGPTNDDITKKALADYFGVKLVQDDQVLEHIDKLVTKRKAEMNERNIKQAEIPENCTVLKNNLGTAPGMLFKHKNATIVSLPGVPFEMRELMNTQVIPLMKQTTSDLQIIHKNILTQGLPESKLAEVLEPWENNLPSCISLAYLPSPGLIKLRLTAKGSNKSLLEEAINSSLDKLKKVIPELICGYNSETLEELIGTLLKEQGKTLSTAESCTGGNIASLITSIAGSSAYYQGSVVAYSNEIKENVLKVKGCSLNEYGAVSKQVVEEMAIGVKKLYKTDLAIATSGIAGPTGGTFEKPIGTTWIAIADSNGVYAEKYIFGDQRERNIKRASLTALNMLQKRLLATNL
ncbi:MAG: competence/damage-inducible protein A [Bacteroidales bacterium]|nr:competence/damage-inducible protein A [Bacteroidales bacterium]